MRRAGTSHDGAPGMFSTVLKFNPKEDYEVDLSPDAINFADREHSVGDRRRAAVDVGA